MPKSFKPKRRRGARGRGLKYEDEAQKTLLDRYDTYVDSPWFQYKESHESRFRWCQPDGLLILPYEGIIVIMEIKVRHTSDAWWQLKHLYFPVVSHAFPPPLWKYAFCEVVRWHDPATSFPESYTMCAEPAGLRPQELGVHILKP